MRWFWGRWRICLRGLAEWLLGLLNLGVGWGLRSLVAALCRDNGEILWRGHVILSFRPQGKISVLLYIYITSGGFLAFLRNQLRLFSIAGVFTSLRSSLNLPG